MKRLLILFILAISCIQPVYAVDEVIGDLQAETAAPVLGEELRKISYNINLKADQTDVDTNTTNIATNTADIATNVSAIAAVITGKVIQFVSAQDATAHDTDWQETYDNTIHQVGEGGEISTLTITPSDVTPMNYLLCIGYVNASHPGTTLWLWASLFSNKEGAGALATSSARVLAANEYHMMMPIAYWQASSADETTISMRIANQDAGKILTAGGAFGGKEYHGIMCFEIDPT